MMEPSVAAFFHPRYVPGAELGRGAQGVVLRVTDLEAKAAMLVAKLWQGNLFRESALHGEFALLSRLRIPGLVRAHDLGRCEKTGAPFLIENFVDGPDAAEWLANASDHEKANRLIVVLTAISSTLARLHESGFLHGDLKPAHVRIVHSGQTPVPTLLDLGAAISRARVPASPIAYTPAFAAPEIRAGAAPSVPSDLYGLGALVFAAATGAPPGKLPRQRLFDQAPWIPPSVARLVEELLADHPQDRPESAREVLHRMGIARVFPGQPPFPMGRDKELAQLRLPGNALVRWVIGPSGSGKTHLMRELYTQVLLEGRDARILRFAASSEVTGQLIAFLRGNESALPFAFANSGRAKPLVILDDTHLAPAELHAAIDAFRCRAAPGSSPIEFLVTARDAPAGAETLVLERLEDAAFEKLCKSLGITERGRIAELAAASDKNPGWLVASVGAIPLERDTALERARTLSEAAQNLLTVIALSGGEVTDSVCLRVAESELTTRDALAELSAAALLTRQVTSAGLRHSLHAPHLAQDLAASLSTPDRTRRTIETWLAESDIPTTVLLSLAKAPFPSPLRPKLLERAAARARTDGVRSQEIEALLALTDIEAERTVDRLLRLERLLRDGEGAAAHPRVLEWLDLAARHDPTLLPLVLRRHAEKLAREGNTDAAREIAEQARQAAANVNDRFAAALALATKGVAALYRADWEEAEACIGQARADLEGTLVHDAEELARVDHNLGVVALYRGRIEQAIGAFERALETKRSLGDRAGIRSCLLNLGLALSKAKRFDDAERVLHESLQLARSLRQTTGQGWCLVARADLAIRREDAAGARQWLAEAAQLEPSLPKPVRADLVLLRAESALLLGDGATASSTLERLDPATRSSDAMVDTRALVIEARARLARLPVEPHQAARLAIRAIRKARGAKLVEMESEAIAALHKARAKRRSTAPTKPAPMQTTNIDNEVWQWLTKLSSGAAFPDAATSLAQHVARASGAERVFLAIVETGGALLDAFGLDIDGLPIALPMRRIAMGIVADALRSPSAVIHRDIDMASGRGSRLAIAGPVPTHHSHRGLLVLEHRFIPSAFDHVSGSAAQQWAILGSLLWQLHAAKASTKESPFMEATSSGSISTHTGSSILTHHDRGGQTTVFPSAERRREFPTIVGRSFALERALLRLDAATGSDLPTLIMGETGTGKELFARALHDFGKRQAEPFVAVNCAAIPDSLFEAELFGHVRGSFTGADRARPGLLARGAKGTVFLDEIGELPLVRQATLLRVLEDRSYRPVGSDEDISFDARIIAATNRNLSRAVADGAFRRDLLYRLNTLEIYVPALRERDGDVPELVRLFLARAGSKAILTSEALAALEAYAWPGNVRELEHVMQRLAARNVEVIERSHLPREIRAAMQLVTTEHSRPNRSTPITHDDAARFEVQRALNQCSGNISRAASLLGLTRHGLKKRMVRLGLRTPSSAVKKEA